MKRLPTRYGGIHDRGNRPLAPRRATRVLYILPFVLLFAVVFLQRTAYSMADRTLDPEGIIAEELVEELAYKIALPAVFLSPDYKSFEGSASIDGYKIQYPMPFVPFNIESQQPDLIWFTAPTAGVVGVVNVLDIVPIVGTAASDDSTDVNFRVDTFPLLANSEPYDLTYADGEIWFTERSANKIGRIDTQTKELTEYDIPTANSGPTGIDVAPDGIVWFVQETGKQLAKFDPASGQFTEIPLRADLFDPADPRPRDLAISGTSRIWFTATGADALVLYNADTDGWLRVDAGDGSGPSHVIIDTLGLPWITTTDHNDLGQFFFGTLTSWKWIEIPAPDSGPVGLAYRRDGNIWDLWYAENRRDAIGRITVNAINGRTVSTQECALATDSQPWGIAVDANRHVWVAEMGTKQITEVIPPYCYEIYLADVNAE